MTKIFREHLFSCFVGSFFPPDGSGEGKREVVKGRVGLAPTEAGILVYLLCVTIVWDSRLDYAGKKSAVSRIRAGLLFRPT